MIDIARLTQRLDDAAVIAGRMAHDFDNVLTGIIGFGELLEPAVPNRELERGYFEDLMRSGAMGKAITQQMHRFSRAGIAQRRPGHIAAAWKAEHPRLLEEHSDRVRWNVQLPSDLPAVALAVEPLQVSLGCLLDNAAEATPDNGTVTLSARLADSDEPPGATGLLGQGLRLDVTVHDAGGGIPESLRSRLFADPFFTTKHRHRGLGLATLFRVLVAHRGDVSLRSDPSGTTATLRLPLIT